MRRRIALALKAVLLSAIMAVGPQWIVPGVSAETTPLACTTPRFVSIDRVTGLEGTQPFQTPETVFSFMLTSTGCPAAGEVSYKLVPGTAFTNDTATRIIPFAEGDHSKEIIQVFVVPDSFPESDESFTVELFLGPDAGLIEIDKGEGIGEIVNDDGSPPDKREQGLIDFHGSEYRFCDPDKNEC